MAMTIGVMARLVSSSIKDGKESGEYTKARSTLLAGIGSNFCASVFSATNAPRPKDSIPTDGPARGATEGQPHEVVGWDLKI